MLAGIGVDAALAVSQAYPTPLRLYRAYKAAITTALHSTPPQSALSAARGLLAALPMPRGPGKLGSERSRLVYDVLFANGWNLAGGA